MWLVRIVKKESNLEIEENVFLLAFADIRKLGIFLQNMDTDIYDVLEMEYDIADTLVLDSTPFIKKDNNLEFGA